MFPNRIRWERILRVRDLRQKSIEKSQVEEVHHSIFFGLLPVIQKISEGKERVMQPLPDVALTLERKNE